MDDKDKDSSAYPVYLANDGYGMRGLDYRAERNKQHGICLLVCSPFSSFMNKKQGLMRVGRFSDNCYRIVNSKMDSASVKDEVDIMKNLQYKAKLETQSKAIEEMKENNKIEQN